MIPQQLSPKQAYLSMFAFLEHMQQTLESDDLAMLLGGLSLLSDGGSADPACWSEWEDAVTRALKEPGLADLVLQKNP